MELILKHSYLFADVCGLPIVALAFIVGRNQRLMMLVSGLLLTLLSPHAVFHNQDYWTPTRIFPIGFGIEDAICCFSLGSVLWLVAIWPFRNRIQLNLEDMTFVRRFILLLLLWGTSWLAFWLLGRGPVTAAVIGQVIVVITVLCLRPSYWPFAVSSLALYPPYYLGILFAVSLIIPEFFTVWGGSTLWGPRIWGLPLDEFVWIISFAPHWSLLMAYSANTRLLPEGATKAS